MSDSKDISSGQIILFRMKGEGLRVGWIEKSKPYSIEGLFEADRGATVTQTIVLKPETRGTLDLDLEDALLQRRVLVPLLGTTYECKNVRT